MTVRSRYSLYPLWLTLFIVGTGGAQVHNAANLYVGSGVEVHVDEAVLNSGFIQNQGDMFVSGDWTNTNVYQGLGQITLQGNAAQRVRNNGNSIYSLHINSAGFVEWQDNLVIDNRLRLTNGIIQVTGTYSLTLATTASVSGGSVRSFVDGPLIVRGTGYKFVPVGTNGGYYPVELLNISGIDPVVKVAVFDQVPSFRLAGYDRILSNVYWQQTALSGTYAGSPVTLGYELPSEVAPGSLDIFQSSSASEAFTAAGNTSVAYESDYDRITTSNAITGSLLVIGTRVVVDPGSEQFYFPTSLSPEAADPDNRSVRVFGEQLADDGFLFVVYNRWGQQIFESRSLAYMSTNGWSGQQQSGGNAASGGYPYLLKGKLKNGEALERKGMISIVR